MFRKVLFEWLQHASFNVFNVSSINIHIKLSNWFKLYLLKLTVEHCVKSCNTLTVDFYFRHSVMNWYLTIAYIFFIYIPFVLIIFFTIGNIIKIFVMKKTRNAKRSNYIKIFTFLVFYLAKKTSQNKKSLYV